jgi:putative Mg2+ transporter-C (MgtC) family protein
MAMSELPLVLGEVIRIESGQEVGRIGLRLVHAAALGLVVGYGRERLHKAAGLRTHMLVCLGSAVAAMSLGTTSVDSNASSRVVQGVLQGIGFLGAGTILKLSDKAEVRGLTTAASIWLTAAVGIATGLGNFWLPTLGAVTAWVVLVPLAGLERKHFDTSGQGT